MFTVVEPAANPAGTEIVNTEDPDVVSAGGSKVAVTPSGRPVTLKVTIKLNPLVGVSVTLRVAVPPAAGNVIQLVSSEIPKSFGATLSVALATCVRVPLVPMNESP